MGFVHSLSMDDSRRYLSLNIEGFNFKSGCVTETGDAPAFVYKQIGSVVARIRCLLNMFLT